jgi:hypothetical protein
MDVMPAEAGFSRGLGIVVCNDFCVKAFINFGRSGHLNSRRHMTVEGG